VLSLFLEIAYSIYVFRPSSFSTSRFHVTTDLSNYDQMNKRMVILNNNYLRNLINVINIAMRVVATAFFHPDER